LSEIIAPFNVLKVLSLFHVDDEADGMPLPTLPVLRRAYGAIAAISEVTGTALRAFVAKKCRLSPLVSFFWITQEKSSLLIITIDSNLF
jgi:hypothetical protein